jgi:hypothetical protein
VSLAAYRTVSLNDLLGSVIEAALIGNQGDRNRT